MSRPNEVTKTSEAERVETFIATGSKIKGTISGRLSLRIAGHVEGQVDVDGLVWVEKTGRIEGAMKARALIIEGAINGDVESSEKTEVRSEGRIAGDITCAKIAVADGCFMQGEIKMTGKDTQPQTFMKKRRSEMDRKKSRRLLNRKQ